MTTLTVSIGRNTVSPVTQATVPLYTSEWEDFKSRLLSTLKVLGAEVHFFGNGHGIYNGATEESFTAVASVDDITNLDYLRHALRILCELFGQECIALTVGQTEFVGG